MLHQYYFAKNKRSFCKENFVNQKSLKKALEIRDQLENYLLDILKKRKAKKSGIANKSLSLCQEGIVTMKNIKEEY